MEWDSFHLGQEYDPYSTVYDEPNQPIHQFDQDNYPNASNINPSMGQNFSRLIPSVTPDVFYSDQIGRRIPAINEKGGKLQKGGKAKTKPVPTKRKK
jgi:hypothetical protein